MNHNSRNLKGQARHVHYGIGRTHTRTWWDRRVWFLLVTHSPSAYIAVTQGTVSAWQAGSVHVMKVNKLWQNHSNPVIVRQDMSRFLTSTALPLKIDGNVVNFVETDNNSNAIFIQNSMIKNPCKTNQSQVKIKEITVPRADPKRMMSRFNMF